MLVLLASGPGNHPHKKEPLIAKDIPTIYLSNGKNNNMPITVSLQNQYGIGLLKNLVMLSYKKQKFDFDRCNY